MQIIQKSFNFVKKLITRKKTLYIILHHRAGNGDVESIHQGHLARGWSGIGYNAYIRKTGEVFQGRPFDKIGAHCPNYNSISIGICFEGNFENEKMNDLQFNSGIALIKDLRKNYPNTQIKGHKELHPTACPGKNFPLEKFKGV